MYERDISRRDPGCVVFLLDRSDSMESAWVNSRETLAEGAARVLNEILLELLFTSQGEPGKARHYFDIGIFGYGLRPVAGGEGVEPAFGGRRRRWTSVRRRAGCRSGWSRCTATGPRCARRSRWPARTSTSGRTRTRT